MALKLYNETDIEAIADAIRGKNGSSDTYTVSQMASAIDDIPTGGGGDWTTDGVANGTQPSGAITISANVESVISRAFQDRKSITAISILGNPYIGNYAFAGCSNLTSISVPNLTKMKQSAYSAAQYVFQACTELVRVAFPAMADIVDSYNFMNCTKLLTADLGACTKIGATFSGCTALRELILRKTNGVCTLAAANASYIGGIWDNPADSSIYVPQSLLSQYQAATNWSSVYAKNNNIFKAIEGSQYENYYGDGTPISS